jgi:prepilin-type N-terminal cleavage/methylation domain-containing protein
MKPTAPPQSTPPARRIRAKGFTLLELLVAVAIILVVAALVMMVTGKIRNKAFQANAMSSLRQVAAANAAFAAENHGDIMTLRWDGDPVLAGNGGWVSNTFWGRLQPYIFGDPTTTNQGQLKAQLSSSIDQLFNSRDADKMAGTVVAGARIYHDTAGLPVPVSFNSNLHRWGRFLKMSSFNDPARVLYATYGFGFFNPTHGRKYVPLPKGGSTQIYYMSDRSALMSFLDGHVESLKPPIPDRMFE